MNAYQAGQRVLCGDYSQYTPTGKSYFVKVGRYYRQPLKYDIVYFYTKSLGRISHTGFVKDVIWHPEDGSFDLCTSEGNTSDAEFDRNGGMWKEKWYYRVKNVGGGNRIDGFGRPLYSTETCTGEDVLKIMKEWEGYEEKHSWDPLSAIYTKHENPGKNNITMMGYWYAGYKKYEAQWCAQTVSWAVYQACVERSKRDTHWNGWRQTDSGDWYYYLEGDPVKGRWSYIDGRWYVFDESGKMIKGWFKQNKSDWYYLADDGGMLSNQWARIDDNNYYFTETGLMAKNAYVKSKGPKGPGETIYYWVNENGQYEPMWDTYRPDLEKYECV